MGFRFVGVFSKGVGLGWVGWVGEDLGGTFFFK